MSLADKINMLMARPGPENAQKDDVPWWMRYGARGLGTVGSSLAIFMGVLNCISILFANMHCMVAGVWQMLAGFLVIICEAPCCCFCIDYVQALSDKIETRPYWNKAVMYMGLALPPFFMCFFSVSTWLGSGLIFGTGILYGMMALGRKASRDDMRTSAANIEAGVGPSTTAPKDNLVTNAQPFSFTKPPQ